MTKRDDAVTRLSGAIVSLHDRVDVNAQGHERRERSVDVDRVAEAVDALLSAAREADDGHRWVTPPGGLEYCVRCERGRQDAGGACPGVVDRGGLHDMRRIVSEHPTQSTVLAEMGEEGPDVYAILDPARQGCGGDGTMVTFGFETLYQRVSDALTAERAARERADRERDEARGELFDLRQDWTDAVRTAQAERDEARRDAKRLRDALDLYGDHESDCAVATLGAPGDARCTCGLDALLTPPPAPDPPATGEEQRWGVWIYDSAPGWMLNDDEKPWSGTEMEARLKVNGRATMPFIYEARPLPPTEVK